MWPPAIFLIIALIAIALFLLVAIVLNGKRTHSFDVEEYQTRWLKIENGLIKTEPRSYVIAILEADKLLDRAMREINIPGKAMGERLKHADRRFSDINSVWRAHKLRNQLAHEPDFEIDYITTTKALASFRQALKDLGAI